MQDSILEFNQIKISFSNSVAVDNVSFSLKSGEILGLVGESGSGKSTIIKSIMAILNDDGKIESGEILFNGENLLDKSEKELQRIRGSRIGMIFQDSAASLCPIRTIGDQVIESMATQGKIDKKKAKEQALKLFEKLNFKDPNSLWNSYPFELSGGMNQRVGIAIAMINNPTLLLADEPTSALDTNATSQVIEELKRIRTDLGTSIIIVTHDMNVVEQVADNIMVLKDGKVMEYGAKSQILSNPQNEYTKMLLEAVPKPRSNGWNLSL